MLRWLCSLDWLGLGSLEGLAPDFLLRSPSELQEVIVLEGRDAPRADLELKRKPPCHARLVRDMSLQCLVSFGP